MSKTKQNISKSHRGGYDLWGKRPLGGCSLNTWNKKRCRKIERRIAKREMQVYTNNEQGR